MLNDYQKKLINDTLSFPLESMTDLDTVTSEQASLALQAIFNDKIYNENIALFKKINVDSELEQIRSILQHPHPQNRSTGDYMSVGQEPGMAVWLDHNDLIAYEHDGATAYKPKVKKEPLGLLSLTSKNDASNVDDPVTKDDVVFYIRQLVNEKLKVLPKQELSKPDNTQLLDDMRSIENQLSTAKIVKILKNLTVSGDKNNSYLVQLDNGLEAVFREISDREQRQEEIIIYKISSRLFKLSHTIPPVVEKAFGWIDGILQYYMPHELKLDYRDSRLERHHEMRVIVNNISRESYADLQTFRYILGIDHRCFLFFLDASNKFCIISTENECNHLIFQKWGETHLGKTDIDNHSWLAGLLEPFHSLYTSFFNQSTINNIKNITKEKIRLLYLAHNYEPNEAYINRIMMGCAEVINVSQSMVLKEKLLISSEKNSEEDIAQTAIISNSCS